MSHAARGSRPSGPTGADGPHALVADVTHPEIDADDRHHLERVLRMRAGSTLTVGDGAGRWRVCTYGTQLEPTSEVREVPRPDPVLTVGFALVKGGRPELIVQKLTELGVDRIAPFRAERSVVRWDETRAMKNLERWRRVAREAVMQCRRCWVPEVLPVGELADFAAGDGVALADPAGEALSDADHTVLVGPEGGWTPPERALVARQVRVADHVLRTETAAMAVATLMVARRRGW